MQSSRQVIIGVAPLLLSTLIMVLGVGLLTTLLPLRMRLEGFSVDRIGLILATYSLGFVAATLICPRLIDMVGHIRVFSALAAIVAATALVHQILVGEILWGVLRFMSGFAVAGMYMIIESWLNARAPNHVRGTILAAYMTVNFLAFAGAQPLLTVTGIDGHVGFAVIGLFVAVSLIPIALTRVETPPPIVTTRLSLGALIRLSPLGVMGSTMAGVINGAFNALGPVYAQAIDPSTTWIATFMATAILGGFALQIPIGHISDRIDRRKVMLGIALLQMAMAILLAVMGGSGWAMLAVLAIYGGLSYTVYPLAVSHANDYLQPSQLLPAAAGLLLCFGVGSTIGPILASQVMGYLGDYGLFVHAAAFAGILAVFTVLRMRGRPTVPQEEKFDHVALRPVTAAGLEMDPHYAPEPDDQLAFEQFEREE